MELKGRIALVTGTSSGIGEVIAKKYLDEGAVVFGCGLDEKSNIERENYSYLKADLTSFAEAEKIVESCIKKYSKIDIVVNCAGITGVGNIENTTAEEFERQFKVNVFAVYNVCKAAIKELKKSDSAAIINIASELGVKPIPDRIAYCPSKAAVVMLTKSLAVDCGPHIRVNGILPALTETPMTKARFEQADNPEEFRRKMNSRYILKRMCRPEDIAEGALFLASNRSSYITGDMLAICGGGHIYSCES
ncbi:SDR family oxidoreductase [Clostridium bovifaecis]|uniref:SDR family oxidoreductase n=1 Tax=Clostridium bovifaecis TaxID=2184719 RepID=A0A6I6F297_9CLOT|nr:SDR family oxidoreductase [Clostridium bovifaecis]